MTLARAAVALAVLATTILAAPTTASAATPLTVWTWNVAGHTMHRGSTTDGMVDAAASSIVNRGADVAVFQELCENQYGALVGKLRALGWPTDPTNFARFEPNLTGLPAVCGGAGFGLAVFSRTTVGTSQRVTLPDDDTPGGHDLLCAGPAAQPTIRLCTTHITTSNNVAADGAKYNERQLAAVLTELEAHRAAGRTAILAGDLNAQPSYGRLDGWYAPTVNTSANGNNRGAYRELDDLAAHCPGYGEWTATGTTTTPCTAQQAKIDLMFVREDRIAGPYDADSLAIPTTCPAVPATVAYPAGSCSDHRVVVGTVTVTG